MILKNPWTNPSEQLKRIEQISRRTRHHQIFLNKIYDEKLQRNLNNLFNKYEQTFKHLKTQEKLERQRKQLLDITINHIAYERQHHSLSTNTAQTEQKKPQIQHHLYILRTSTTSFINKEHDQILQQRNLSNKNSNVNSFSSNLQEEKYQSNCRQLVLTIHHQYHLVNRYDSIKRIQTSLDEQSRLLHKQLFEKKNIDFTNNYQHNLKQAIQRHLRISAKFCA
ncbi:unnamed protein product [Rotaria sordida]|uniref:Uncharacterized protein n=1 Tax=Rotaria sordida TaxID=392033 RepID=A0A819VEF4_9BILA|nr:unnamed protein product [Rotaria sordida]